MEAEKQEYKKGLWTEEEDTLLLHHVRLHGTRLWNRIPKLTGLRRCGKSCRLRWLNYLSPNVKKGDFSQQEDDLIIRLHNLLGNRWSLIAGRVPGRTDNQVKNHWNTHLSKKPTTTTPTSKRRRLSVSNSTTTRPSRHVDASNNIITDLKTSEVVVGNTRNQNLGNGGSVDQEVPPIMGNCLPSMFSDDYSYFMNFTHVPHSTITATDDCMDSELDLIWKGF